mmetsp:Transcript_91415/g.191093  ORF Transcript_91415/g.191093 Transcript_91415/m.191093 type:complete len:117 (-) Transcript_91415:690-1040(-)
MKPGDRTLTCGVHVSRLGVHLWQRRPAQGPGSCPASEGTNWSSRGVPPTAGKEELGALDLEEPSGEWEMAGDPVGELRRCPRSALAGELAAEEPSGRLPARFAAEPPTNPALVAAK